MEGTSIIFLLLAVLAIVGQCPVEAGALLKGLTKSPLGGLMGGAAGGAGGSGAHPVDYCCKQVMKFAPPPPWMSSYYPSVPKKGRQKGKKEARAGADLLKGLGLGGFF